MEELVEASALERGLAYLECTICFDFPRPKTKLRCCSLYGHLVCDICWIKLRTGPAVAAAPTCPTCKSCTIPGNWKNFVLDHLFEQLSLGWSYSCKYEDYSCADKIRGSDLEHHELVCPDRPSICPGKFCKLKAPYHWFASMVPTVEQMHHQTKCFARSLPWRFNEWLIAVDANQIVDSLTGRSNKNNFQSQILLGGRYDLALHRHHQQDVRMCVRLYTKGARFNVVVIWMEDEKTAKALRVADPKIRVEFYGQIQQQGQQQMQEGRVGPTTIDRSMLKIDGGCGGVAGDDEVDGGQDYCFSGKPIFQDCVDKAPWNEQHYFIGKKTAKDFVLKNKLTNEEGKLFLLFRVRLVNGGVLK